METGLDRKWLIIASTLASCAILILVPISPSLPFMLGASFGLGFASVAPQLAVPYAAGLVPGAGRGKVVGTVMSGLIIFAFLAMLFSGQNTLIMIGLGVLLLDAGAQGNQIANQARIYTLNPALHSRINFRLHGYLFLGRFDRLAGRRSSLGLRRMARRLPG